MEIFIGRDGEQWGPFSLEETREHIAQGRVSLADTAWYEGLAGWIPLSEVPGMEAAPAKKAVNPRKKRSVRQRGGGGKVRRPRNQRTDHLAAANREISNFEYVGFWVRVVSSGLDGPILATIAWIIIDVLQVGAFIATVFGDPEGVNVGWLFAWVFAYDILMPILVLLLYPLLGHIIEILFWVYLSATPGKLALRMKIVDAGTGRRPSAMQFIIRSLAKWISLLPLGLGFLWAAFDHRKRCWHDLLAGTTVVMVKDGRPDYQQRKEFRREGGSSQSDADEISKLADLRDKGLLTEVEFQQKKAQILGL